jgi:hypothetical protein
MGAKVADVDENAKEMRRFLYIYYKMSIFALKNKLYEKDKFYRTDADGRADHPSTNKRINPARGSGRSIPR